MWLLLVAGLREQHMARNTRHSKPLDYLSQLVSNLQTCKCEPNLVICGPGVPLFPAQHSLLLVGKVKSFCHPKPRRQYGPLRLVQSWQLMGSHLRRKDNLPVPQMPITVSADCPQQVSRSLTRSFSPACLHTHGRQLWAIFFSPQKKDIHGK